jgi:parallel beta-helix repeat protein
MKGHNPRSGSTLCDTGARRAVIILALSLTLTTCDNYNQSLKEEVEYNESVVPAHNAADLRAAIAAIPPGGSGTVTVMRSLTVGGSPVVIEDGRKVTVEAYSGTTTVAILTRGAGFDDAFFDVSGGASLSLRGGRKKGTLILDGGGVDANAPLVTVTGGELTLGDRAILRNNKHPASETCYGGGVYVDGGSFTMTGGTITGNDIDIGTGGYGGGVAVTGGSFRMTGGTIAGNTVRNLGGGVYVEDCAFTMTGGNITGNSAPSGGGVYVDGGSFTMTGGNITGNTTNSNSGGVSVDGGSFTMTGGTISGNTATHTTGGVYIANGGSFTLEGGTISGNSTGGSGGGVRIGSSGSFTMTGGTISGNTVGSSDNYGGGVHVGGSFTMTGGEITGNTADYGGGVCVWADSSFTMTGGEIGGNTAGSDGGGVYVKLTEFIFTTIFSKSGGTIYGDTDTANTPPENTATGGTGHAVYLEDSDKKRNSDVGPTVKLYAKCADGSWDYDGSGVDGINENTDGAWE